MGARGARGGGEVGGEVISNPCLKRKNKWQFEGVYIIANGSGHTLREEVCHHGLR